MALVPCDWYYENILGDNCNNKCRECFGDEDVRICKEDFEVEVVGGFPETLTVKKGSWWSLIFINDDHVLLDAFKGYKISLNRDLFDLYFENFIYEDMAERD